MQILFILPFINERKLKKKKICSKIIHTDAFHEHSWTLLPIVRLCKWIVRMDTPVKTLLFKGIKRKSLYPRSLYIQSMKANESKDLIKIAAAILCDMEALNIFCKFSIAKSKGWGNKGTTWIINTHYHLFTSQISFQEQIYSFSQQIINFSSENCLLSECSMLTASTFEYRLYLHISKIFYQSMCFKLMLRSLWN